MSGINESYQVDLFPLTSISIKNFRAIEELEINNFGQFNLIVGKNNVGKTTLLESILLCLNSYGGLDSLFKRRGWKWPSSVDFLFGTNLDDKIEIIGKKDNYEHKLEIQSKISIASNYYSTLTEEFKEAVFILFNIVISEKEETLNTYKCQRAINKNKKLAIPWTIQGKSIFYKTPSLFLNPRTLETSLEDIYSTAVTQGSIY